jgi:hypothetical protein
MESAIGPARTGRRPSQRGPRRGATVWLALMTFGLLAVASWMAVGDAAPAPAGGATAAAHATVEKITLWEPLLSPNFATYEKIYLVATCSSPWPAWHTP